MNILFISRATLYTNPGGDTVQITNTADYLKKLGVAVDIRLTNKVIEYSSYDLLHFFNIIRPADILYHIKKSGKPYVVSTIFVEYAEAERHAFTGFRRSLFSLLPADTVEYIKVLARYIVNKEKLVSPFYLLHGHRRSVQKVIAQARLLLPNSHSEYTRLVKRYQTEQQYQVIPNGIDTGLFASNEKNSSKENDLVLCVARIEPLKNQLNLIRALSGTHFRLLIIGSASINQRKYYEQCKQEVRKNVQFIDRLSQADLIAYYRKAKVHVLPSWFETTGLSSLEAAAMGCNIVITDKGDTREYFKDYAYYCDPSLPESIFDAVSKAAIAAVNKELDEMIRKEYTWQRAAEKTLSAYREILTN